MPYSSDPMIAASFPMRLYAILETEDALIVSWTKSGLAFRVKDLARFREETLPKYYRHNKITSFQRQLNLYGFARLNKGEDCGCYAHPKFIRGHQDQIRTIRRLQQQIPVVQKASMEQSASIQNLVKISSSPAFPTGQVKKCAPGKSLLSKNIGFVQTEPLESKIEQCREAQFKSSFHQTTYGWRQMLESALPLPKSEDIIIENDLLSCPILEVDEEQKRVMTSTEVISESFGDDFDFDDYFTGSMEIQAVNGCGQSEQYFEQELLDLLL